MKKNKTRKTDDLELGAVMQELHENPYQKFNSAFALMSIIPFLVFFYILVGVLFNFDILVGNIGVTLFISLIVSLIGFYTGYTLLKKVLNKIILYAAEAKHSDQLKSTFVATVSHELKNPIAVMKVGLSNVLDGLAGPINNTQKEALELCRNVSERMNLLVTDLLDLHKIEAGMTDVKRESCDFTEIINTQVKEFEGLLDKKRIKLFKEISDKNLSMWADRYKIERVINNILSNAIKFTPEGGAVTMKASKESDFVRLECTDTGPGIPSDKISKVFDKFERLGSSKEGTGLGLAITKDIVEMHKGKVWAESVMGIGSKFIIVLPCDLRHSKR